MGTLGRVTPMGKWDRTGSVVRTAVGGAMVTVLGRLRISPTPCVDMVRAAAGTELLISVIIGDEAETAVDELLPAVVGELAEHDVAA